MRKHTLCHAVHELTRLLWRSTFVDFGAMLALVAATVALAVVGIDCRPLMTFASGAALVVMGLLALALVTTALDAALDDGKEHTGP